MKTGKFDGIIILPLLITEKLLQGMIDTALVNNVVSNVVFLLTSQMIFINKSQ